MFEKEMVILNKAYKQYNLDNRYDIAKKVLTYIRGRIEAEKDLIEKLIKITNEKINFSEILETFDKVVNEKEVYKKEYKITKLENNFAFGKYTTSIGNIVVECSDTLKVLEYYIQAIKSRNTITISDNEYDELNVKSALLIIFSEALSKFNINPNLIMLVPFEECYYDEFDEIIYLDDENRIEKKQETNKLYIYVENENFNDVIENEKEELEKNNKKYEIIKGNFETAVSRINSNISDGAVIYTENPQTAYEFINLVHAKNVFVNTSLLEIEQIGETKNELYTKKKIMYPLKNQDENKEDNEKGKEEKQEKQETKKENKQLMVVEHNPWYKRIIDAIKSFFKR